MDMLVEYCKTNGRYVAAGAAAVVITGLAFRFFHKAKKDRVCGKDYPKDTVILHIYPREKLIPNLGHFALKLEAYLRVTKLPYEAICVRELGPKHKIPWIEYNGITMGDSTLIIEFLEKEFKMNLDAHLTQEEKALAWAIQKWIEEWTYWLNVQSRWVIHLDTYLNQLRTVRIRKWSKPLFLRWIKGVTYTIGVGRHTPQEVETMMVNDLRHFSAVLGKKPFLMGQRISNVDCAAFGILGQVMWGTPKECPGNALLVSGELQNVTNYLNRIKETYFPDWDELCKTEKAD